jgi:Zn-finger nucleic acid-binding protein
MQELPRASHPFELDRCIPYKAPGRASISGTPGARARFAASRRTLNCPNCRAGAYRVLRTGQTEVDVCNGCGGLFLDLGEATHFLENLRNAPPPKRLPRTFDAKRRKNEEIIDLMLRLFF